MEILDETMRRKLIKRRGQLHAFPNFDSARTALVLIDLTVGFMGGLRGRGSLIPTVNRLSQAAQNAAIPIYWITTSSIHKWRNPDNALSLLGRSAGEDNPDSAQIDPRFTRYADNNYMEKSGYSAFFPSSCELGHHLISKKLDTVILGGVLTDICITSSARDAFETGFKVLIAEDSCDANDPLLHQTALRTLARGFADIHSSAGVISLIENANASVQEA